MKKIELVLIGLLVLALIMRFFHLPDSGILLVMTLALISMGYMYLGFALFNDLKFRGIFKKESYKDISLKRIIGGVGAGLALSASVMGILFKFQSLPGASELLWIGLVALLIVMLVSFVKIRKNIDNYYSNILKRVAFFGALCAFLIVIPSKNWLNWKYPNHPEYVKAVLNAEANPDVKELWEKVGEEWEKMSE